MAKQSFLKRYRLQIFGCAVLLGLGAWMGATRFTTPAEINLVALEQRMGADSGQMCTQIAGTCVSGTGQCVSFADGCQRARLCAEPYRACDAQQPVVTQPVPPAGCYYRQVQCARAPCNPILVCQSPTPRPTCAPRPACLDGNPACMVAMPEQGWCPASSSQPSPIPSPTPTCRTGVTSLKVTNRCGATGFRSYEFSCEGSRMTQTNAETCLEASAIYERVKSACSTACEGRSQ